MISSSSLEEIIIFITIENEQKVQISLVNNLIFHWFFNEILNYFWTKGFKFNFKHTLGVP